MTDAEAIAANVAAVRQRIADAAQRAGRDPREITLVGASKTMPADACAAAVTAGCSHLGENRAQDLLAKAPELAGGRWIPVWHFIGQLQRNKVRQLAPWVHVWESVDRAELADEIARRAPGAAVFVEVNIAGEQQKGGCARGDLPELVDHVRDLGLDLRGLMTVPPFGSDPRPHFQALRTLVDTYALPECSMGMTDDFELAIEAGATTVRVGRAIFGAR
ncbi:MAG: YggS family pyridoxal phosphate-dependent enzyme [Acidimicrobiia bacterium]